MKKIIIVGIFLLILWGSFIWFAINYAGDLRTHPCSICAEKVGEDVVCYAGDTIKTFAVEGEIKGDTKWDNPK